MILAAGYGKRLRPLTDHTPKPLISIGGKPMIVHHLEKLAEAGIREVVINLGHLGSKIPDFIGTGSTWGVSLSLIHISGPRDRTRSRMPSSA